MKYSETGHFNNEQWKTINEFCYFLDKIQRLECCVTVNSNGNIIIYKMEDIINSSKSLYDSNTDTHHPLRGTYVGSIDRQFSETPCFREGYITEE